MMTMFAFWFLLIYGILGIVVSFTDDETWTGIIRALVGVVFILVAFGVI